MRVTNEEIEKAVALLNRSDRGQQAMRDFLAMLDNGAVGLDADAKIGLSLMLLATATGTVLDALREAVGD